MDQLPRIEMSQFAVLEDTLPGDPDIRNLLAAGRIYQLRDRVVKRTGFHGFEINGGNIRPFSDFEGAGFIGQTQCAGTIQGGHSQHTMGG